MPKIFTIRFVDPDTFVPPTDREWSVIEDDRLIEGARRMLKRMNRKVKDKFGTSPPASCRNLHYTIRRTQLVKIEVR